MITINENNKECKFCDLEAMLNKSPVSYNGDYSNLSECDKCILHFALVMLRRQAEFLPFEYEEAFKFFKYANRKVEQ